jgi:mono/diheme cytochrome c family protein
LPEGWKRRDYGDREKNKSAEWKALPAAAHSGQVGVRCISRDNADTSLFQDVPLKRGATYVLSGWVKTHAMRGKVSFNDHIGRAETDQVKARESDWVQVEVMWTNRDKDKASINILHVGKGDGFFDDLSLAEALPVDDEEKVIAGDLKRGEDIFWKHPVAACKNCHLLKGQGSAVGPALDGIASRKDEAYITESLLNPNARLAEGYVATPISPMPPMGLILKPQELADVKAFILSLK